MQFKVSSSCRYVGWCMSLLGQLKAEVHLIDTRHQILTHRDLKKYAITKLKTNSQCKCPENFFGKCCPKSKYENMGKIFKNYTRRSSSLKTNWKMKSFTESCSEPCETSKKELLAKIVISFSFFQKNSILDVWKRSEYSSFHGHFSYAPKLRESFMKSRSTDSLCDQNYNDMKRN